MINPNPTPKEKALVAARLLRENAFIPVDNSRTIRPDTKPGIIAADAIEQLVKENEALHARLVAIQKALNPAVGVEPVAHPQTAHWRGPFTTGAYVRLKVNPDHRGKVTATRIGDYLIQSCYVQFKTPFEHGYWVDAQRLELIPDE
ncbi:hypothetical protein HVF61_002323 [Salmonella enterica]|nr:hypothetical protein [Salmonella enterica]